MGRKIKLKNIIFLCGILVLIPSLVNARSVRDNELCINTDSGSNYYKLTNMGSKVLPAKITYQDITGAGKYPALCYCSTPGDGCLSVKNKVNASGSPILGADGTPVVEISCARDYQFTVESQSYSCKRDVQEDNYYSFYICPGNNSYNVVSQMQRRMDISYIASSNQYKVTFGIPSDFRGKVSARLVRKIRKNGTDVFDINKETGLPNSNASILRYYSTDEINNGIYFSPGSEFYLIFYLSDSSDGCNGERLGYIMGAVPSTVPNPMYNDSICTDFRRKYAPGSVERIMASACDAETIQFSELSTIRNTVINKLAEVDNIHRQLESTVSPTNNFTCLFENNSTEINTQPGFSTKVGFLDIAGTGSYWKALCTETISIEYEDPKAVRAGGGFGYNTKAVINRTCTPVKIAEPKYLPKCKYSVECWGGPANHNGEAGAGPNEDFDQCVNTCDGGKYTQSCIDSCYSKIYGKSTTSSLNTKKLSNSSFLSFGKKNYELTRLATNKGNPALIGTTDGGQTNLPISSGCIISGNNQDNGCGTVCGDETWCRTEHGVTFIYLNSCNADGESSGTQCYEVFTNYPCDDGADYKRDILASEAEYNNVVAAIQEFSSSTIDNEKYEIVVEEDYNRKADRTYDSITTVFSNKDGDHSLAVTLSSELVGSTHQSDTNLADPSVGDLDSTFISEHVQKSIYSYQIERTIDLNLPAAYVSRVDGNDIIYNDSNSPTDSTLDRNPKYFSPENKYFTKFNTRIINNYLNWPYFNNAVTSDSTDAYTKNIHVRLYNIGSWNQWGTIGTGVNVDCLYGVVPGIVTDCDPGDPDCPTSCIPGDSDCPPGDGGNGEGNGIRYIFRPIRLDDMFPNNRNPRFNWTGTIDRANNTSSGAALLAENSLYGTPIDPQTLIETIQAKNESIYNVTVDASEVDYDFVLTKENIRNIRKYNKNIRDYNGDGDKNYLDYNMSCYTNSRGQEVCSSKFLDNINGNIGTDSSDNFITYSTGGYGIDERKAIIGCNNARAGQCDIISN